MVFERKRLDQSKRSFILKDIGTGEGQSLYKSCLKDAMWLSLLKDLFGTSLAFKIVLDLEEF